MCRRPLLDRSDDNAPRIGQPLVLISMTPRDRRLIHLALEDGTGVTAESRGEGGEGGLGGFGVEERVPGR
jgi:predicted RNA-binding protein Jag